MKDKAYFYQIVKDDKGNEHSVAIFGKMVKHGNKEFESMKKFKTFINGTEEKELKMLDLEIRNCYDYIQKGQTLKWTKELLEVVITNTKVKDEDLNLRLAGARKCGRRAQFAYLLTTILTRIKQLKK